MQAKNAAKRKKESFKINRLGPSKTQMNSNGY